MKNVIITGASGNLGQAAVEKFIREGYRVIATVSPGKTLGFDSPEVVTYQADLTNEAEVTKVVQEIIEHYGSIDAALLLVGGFAQGGINETDGVTIKKMLNLNFDTAYNVARPVFHQMLEQRDGGKIVFVGARGALHAQEGKQTLAYSLSKSLIFKLSELLNATGADKNVVSTVIVPSTIDTPVNRKANPEANFSQWVTPEEIADIMAFATSNKSRALRETVLKVYAGS